MVTQEKNGSPDEGAVGLAPAAKISMQDWMSAPETRAVMAALGEAQGQALFVGGCVRGAILGEGAGDVDIATKLTPDEATKKLESAGIRVIPTGVEHGTVTAVMNGRPFEITTLRKDVETDGRRAVVAFTGDWREDALRRDFTMNTLLADSEGRVYDPLGGGLEDLKNRRVIFVGDPAERIAEDALRILRFFRFYALYGRGEPDAAALMACRAAAEKVLTLSRERVAQEFFRILVTENAPYILNLMFKNNVLINFFNVKNHKIFSRLCENQAHFSLESAASRLWLLCGMQAKNLNKAEEVIMLSNEIKGKINSIYKVMSLSELNNKDDVRIAVYKHGREAVAQALLIDLSVLKSDIKKASEFIDIAIKWDVPKFPVSGADLIAQGFKPGPELGAKLKALEEEWIVGGFQASFRAT